MIPRLVRAELVRLRSRRSFWVFALAALALLAAFQIAVNAQVRPPDAAEITRSQVDYLQATQQYQDQVKECKAGGGSTADCDFGAPTPDEFVRSASSFAEIAPTSLMIGAVLSWLVAYLVGSAFSGGEFSTGSIGNWLTFVPRRGAVFASKLIALVLGCAVFAAIMTAVAIAVPALLVQLHQQAPTEHLAPVVATGGRGVGITVALAGSASVSACCSGTRSPRSVSPSDTFSSSSSAAPCWAVSSGPSG